MINKATNIINKGGIYPYKYIIIDEYQDTSLNKCVLIKAIQNKTNASLMAVGDDWQSIYRFTGSNLKIFTDFKNYFPNAKILKLKNFFVPQFRYADYFIKEIIRQIEYSENKDDYFYGVASLVRKYFNENNFYITPEGFVIYYPLYSIAPYYTGIQTFTIPFSCFSPEVIK